MSYYRTTPLPHSALAIAKEQCNRQEREVLAVFKAKTSASPAEVAACLAVSGLRWPLTSVRRAIHDLTDKGILLKTDRLTNGAYGKPEHVWRLASREQQAELFTSEGGLRAQRKTDLIEQLAQSPASNG